MLFVIYLTAIFLASIFIAVPYLRLSKQLTEKLQQDSWQKLQLRVVKSYYPGLKRLSYSEIAAGYDLDLLYDAVGRFDLVKANYDSTPKR